MTRSKRAEITVVKERITAVAKGTAPVTRRAAAQLRDDLCQWQQWKSEGVQLPRLPRRIRLGLIPKPAHAHCAKQEIEEKNKFEENVQKVDVISTKSMKPINATLPVEQVMRYLVADHQTCLAIAIAITRSEQVAEEVLSECVVSAVEQINAGKCRADNAARFHAWLHTIVRRNAMRRAGQSDSKFVEYTDCGDIAQDIMCALDPEYQRIRPTATHAE